MSAAISDLVAVKFHPMRDNILIRRRLTDRGTTTMSGLCSTALIPR